MRVPSFAILCGTLPFVLVACASSAGDLSTDRRHTGGPPDHTSTTTTTDMPGDGTGDMMTTDDPASMMPALGTRCGGTAPAAARHAPAPRPYSGGTCPTLSAGRNTLRSSGSRREFVLILP